MKGLIIFAAPFILALYLGAAIAGRDWPAWARWSAAFLAGLASWLTGAVITFYLAPEAFKGAMASWPVCIIAALASMWLYRCKRRRLQ